MKLNFHQIFMHQNQFWREFRELDLGFIRALK